MTPIKVLIVVGPTSSGKSALAVEIARKFGGEVISADSRQVYRGLNIGTGKVTKREMRGIPHHLLNEMSPHCTFSAHDFQIRALSAIADNARRGTIPIVCGGTGFYIDALMGRIPLPDVPPNKTLRAKLKKMTATQLFAMLKKRDPRRAQSMNSPSERNNKVRLIRALEIATAGKSRLVARAPLPTYDALWIGIAPPLNTLRKKINTRLSARIRRGMIAEARRLHAGGLSYKRMHELGLEYRSLARFLQNKISRTEMEEELQYAIWHYAKRQIRYRKRNKNIQWFKKPDVQKISKTIRDWIKNNPHEGGPTRNRT